MKLTIHLNGLLFLLFIAELSIAQQGQFPSEPIRGQLPATDWLLDGSSYTAGIYRGESDQDLVLSNGLIRRTFRLSPNAATIGFDNLMTGETLLRGIKPEAELVVDGKKYEIGGLKGQPNYAFLRPAWIDSLYSDPAAFSFKGYEMLPTEAPFDWRRVRHAGKNLDWPPKGVHLRMDYELPGTDLLVSVHYELYDGIPVMTKWLKIRNIGTRSHLLNDFSSEILAAVEFGSAVESRAYRVQPPNIHVETDYAFASMTANDANHHVVHWETDPDYLSQVSYERLTPCLLRVSPEIGPSYLLEPDGVFTSFRTFLLPFDSYDRERQGLAQRRMYRILAPWTTENPLMMHARFADWERVKTAIDQAADVGFEMIILTFGSGFNIENEDPAYLDEMRGYADYAHSKGLEIGGYSLLASRTIDEQNDVVLPEGRQPTFGHSPCIGSSWGLDYFRKLYRFYERTGFSLLEHDGSYPGDPCFSTVHPGHRGAEDSRWNQYQVISDFYKWCRGRGIYLNIPDYYYLTGGNKCGMGYREVNWSLPREQQVIHTRQNIYDGTWDKGVTMGWMFVPLTEYQGGGEAATIEPLHEHLDHYERMMMSNLGAGVQACYRGPRLYDTPETREMVTSAVGWFKKHREVLEGDLIHLRRADARDADYWLMVNPDGTEKGALVVFNPLDRAISKTIQVPLYYTGLQETVRVFEEEEETGSYELDRDYSIFLPVQIPAKGWKAYFFR